MQTILYKIRNWDSVYENNRTRELKQLSWVPVPNKQDGDGYTAAMELKSGPALYGAFVACVQIASRCRPRGVLIRDNGAPHTSQSLARMSRMPATLIQEMLEKYSESNDVNWIQKVTYEDPAGGCDNPASSCGLAAEECLERKKEGKERKEQGELGVTADPCEIYDAYPKKVDRPAAIKAIEKALKRYPHQFLLERTGLYAAAWRDQDTQYCPYPATWFNGERFNDDPQTWNVPKETKKAKNCL